MKIQDLHTHSNFDDGKSTLEEMVRAAIEKGLGAIGLSGHSPLPFEAGWCIKKARLPEYFAEAARLREKYAGQIDVLCGMEMDNISEYEPLGLDYTIGSVHHITADGQIFSVDASPEETRRYVRILGGTERAEQLFYAEYDKIARGRCDIVGHFDLITKFDEEGEMFERLPQCAVDAMEKLVRAGKIFEINTGAISRGYRKTPYPAAEILMMLRKLDARITVNSDAHSAASVAFEYQKAEDLAYMFGFREIWQYHNGFEPVKL